MLSAKHKLRGFSMLELLVGIMILAILAGVGAPSFLTWIQNAQLRTAAESISSGLQLARAEAVRRNAPVRFQLMDTLDSTCSLSLTANNWVVSMDDSTGLCDNAPTADTVPVLPRIIQKHTGAEGTPNVTIVSDASVVIFNGLGRASNAMTVQVTNPTGGDCRAAGGLMRCLSITVATGGQTRMCNPALPGTNPQGC